MSMEAVAQIKPRPSRLLVNVQPVAWMRAIIVGIFGAMLMMGFIDVFYSIGMTPFSYEKYLGSLWLGASYPSHVWTLGFLASCLVGAIAGPLYGTAFEYIYKESRLLVGLRVAIWHTVAAALGLFPFFNILHQEMGHETYPAFGFLGSSLDPGVPILIIIGHLLFGLTMSTLYGPVRADRIRANFH